MTRRIFKYRIPIDDQHHDIPPGDIVHVGHQPGDSEAVMVWAWHEDAPTGDTRVRRVLVVGTGHEVPWWANHYHGTAIDPLGLVWHLVGPGFLQESGLPRTPDLIEGA